MRTTKNQKITNYILAKEPQHKDCFCSIVDTDNVYYNGQKAIVVTYAIYINENQDVTTCRKIVIKDYDLVRHHKGNLPYDHFEENISIYQ